MRYIKNNLKYKQDNIFLLEKLNMSSRFRDFLLLNKELKINSFLLSLMDSDIDFRQNDIDFSGKDNNSVKFKGGHIRIGKLLNNIIKQYEKDNHKLNIEEVDKQDFVLLYSNFTNRLMDDHYKVSVNKGYFFSEVYNCGDVDDDTDLVNSCMNNKDDMLYLYESNDDVCSVAYIEEEGTQNLLARAIIWKTDQGFYFMDRIYFTDLKSLNSMIAYAIDNKIVYKKYQESLLKSPYMKDGKELENLNMSVSLKFDLELEVPYLDTFKFADYKGEEITKFYNYPNINGKRSYNIRLEKDNGEFEYVYRDLSDYLNIDDTIDIDTEMINLSHQKDLKSLEGIDKFKNLKVLDVSSNNLEDISHLDSLPLESIDLSRNSNLKDISVLKTLSDLTELNINRMEYINLDTISDIKLEILSAYIYNLDIKPLENMVTLKELTLNEPINIEVIGNLKNLEYLEIMISDRNFDFKILDNLTKLKRLVFKNKYNNELFLKFKDYKKKRNLL